MAIENYGGEDLTPDQIKEIIAERDSAKAAVNSTVQEIKDMRQKKQDLEAAKADLEKKLAEATKPAGTPEDVDSIVEKKLTEKLSLKESEEAKVEQEMAWNEFVSKNPEFDPENDKTGLRAETFKKELSRFNMSGARKKDDFLNAMQDAITLLYRKENREYVNPYASSSSRSGSSSIVHDNSASLTTSEKETMTRLGWDLKKFNDMKLRHPELFVSVFNNK